MFRLKSKISFGSEEGAKAFSESIGPELREKYSRSKTTIKRKGKKLSVCTEASDRAAMRASLNPVSKPLKMFTRLEEIE